jgi:hypothetical protein
MLALIFRRFLNLLGYGENSAIATADRRRFFDNGAQKRHIFEAVSGVSAIAAIAPTLVSGSAYDKDIKFSVIFDTFYRSRGLMKVTSIVDLEGANLLLSDSQAEKLAIDAYDDSRSRQCPLDGCHRRFVYGRLLSASVLVIAHANSNCIIRT